MDERAERERQRYNEGLRVERGRYDEVLSFGGGYHDRDMRRDVARRLERCRGAAVLELGSSAWVGWLEKNRIYPARLEAINISEKELEIGAGYAAEAAIKPRFRLMDAHRLEYPDDSFAAVFGAGILHHLELERALKEIRRVLAPGGLMLFVEPLGANPVGKLVRRLTPGARTADERPLGRRELALVNEHFAPAELIAYQLLSVPLGVASRLFSRTPLNPLAYLGYTLDRLLLAAAPELKVFCRMILIAGQKPN